MGRKKIKPISSIFTILIFFILFLLLFIPDSFGQVFEAFSYSTNNPPIIDGVITENEWNNAWKKELNYHYLLMKNDGSNLYILLDVVGDISENVSLSEDFVNDYFWLSFDVDRDLEISSDEDVLFSPIRGSEVLGKAYHLRAGATTGLYGTVSKLGKGFGPSLNSDRFHRFWELSINLGEINAIRGGSVNMGYRINSHIPLIYEEYPLNYSFDFSNLIEVDLGVNPTPSPTIQITPSPSPIPDFELPLGPIIGASLGIGLGLLILILFIKFKK
ncbi:MAG: hypothetical protein ACXAAT_18910 [Candidatus Hodarchaeales archaeon]